MMGAAAQTLFDFEFGLSSYMRLEINMPLFAARRTVLSAAAAAALLVLTGCSKSDDAKSSASSADTLEKPTLVVGMELAYPPFEGKDEQGNPAGVSVDFMKDFAKSAGKAIKIENIAFDGLIPALLTGKVDMVMSSMTITDERRKTVDFSDPYANAMLGTKAAALSPLKISTRRGAALRRRSGQPVIFTRKTI
jgi:ABC-type amino acid transport substrate-binding protein